MHRFENVTMPIVLALLLTVVFAWGVSAQQVWSNAAYEGGSPVHDVPTASSAASDTPGRFQSTRNMVGERAMVEHFWSDYIMADDNALHRMGSARVYLTSTAPTSLADSHTDAAGLVDHNNTGGAGEGDFNDPASNSGGAVAEDDVGHGRIWVDSDDYRAYVYEGVAGSGNPAPVADGWQPLLADGGLLLNPQGYNLIYNGSFETEVIGNVNVPQNWDDVGGTPTFAYVTASTDEDIGVALEVTATAINDEVSQLLTNLKGSSTYLIVARVYGGAGDSCSITTSGAAVNASATSTATSPATLTATFDTAAPFDNVRVNLESDAATDVCTWDNVAVYEQNDDPIPQPGALAIVVEDETQPSTSFADGVLTDSGMAVAVTVPGPGYVLIVNARIVAENSGGGANHLQCELREDTVAVDGVTTTASTVNEHKTIPLRHVNTFPTPGNTYDYVVFCAGEGSTWLMNDVIPSQLVTTRNFIDVVMIPTR